jgi:hypothetical protein
MNQKDAEIAEDLGEVRTGLIFSCMRTAMRRNKQQNVITEYFVIKSRRL